MQVLETILVPVRTDADVVTARHEGRKLASRLRFGTTTLTFVATAISEVARNIVQYAQAGEVRIDLVEGNGRRGIQVTATDRGPGIPDIPRVLQGGFSTGRSLGLGLSGARRLMDEFQIESVVGQGTTITMRRWERGDTFRTPREAGDRA